MWALWGVLESVPKDSQRCQADPESSTQPAAVIVLSNEIYLVTRTCAIHATLWKIGKTSLIFTRWCGVIFSWHTYGLFG